jgi:cobalt-zinc-cadmium efflux system outer membrane protein
MSPYRWLPVLVAGATFATSVHAEPLTFSQALERARVNAPSLQARALDVDAARASARAAGVLPDPRLTLGLDNFPVSGPPAGRFGADEMTMARIGVMQDVPSNAERRAQRLRASADIGVAQAQVAVEARRIRLAAALAWVDLYYAQRRLAALDHVLEKLEPLWGAEPSGVASGAIRPSAALAPVRMRGELEDQRSELAAAVGRARAELVRWTADPAVSTAGEPPSLDIDLAALRAGLDDHPAVAAYRSAGERARAELDLARAAKRPDWSWEASYARRDPMFGDMVSAGVSVRLPLFASSRQEPQIEARRADASRVTAEREDARRSLAAQLDADYADHVMHHEQWLRTRDVLLPNAQRQADLETASYAASRAGLADVIEAFGLVAGAQLQSLEREAAVARDGVRITLTYGSQDQ